MKKNNKLVTILLASSLLLPGIAPLATGVTSVSAATETAANEQVQYRVVTEEAVRFRTEENAKPVALVSRGDKVTFIEEVNNKWFKVEVNGKTGYILRGNVTSEKNYNSEDTGIHEVSIKQEAGAEESYVVAVRTALRTKDEIRYRPLEILDRGSEVKYLGTTVDNNWFKVSYDGVEGYVQREDVTKHENMENGQEADLSYDIYTEEASPALNVLEATITTALRTRPGSQYSAMGEIARGAQVKYDGTVTPETDWFLVTVDGSTQGYVHRSHLTKVADEDIEIPEELTVESASAINANNIKVTLSDDSEHTVTLEEALKANVAKEVTFEIDGKEYTANVIWEVAEEDLEDELLAAKQNVLVKERAEAAAKKTRDAIDKDKNPVKWAEAQAKLVAAREELKEAKQEVEDIQAAIDALDDIAAAVKVAEEAIKHDSAKLANLDEASIDWVRGKVDAALALNPNAKIEGIEKLVAAEAKLAEQKLETEKTTAANKAVTKAEGSKMQEDIDVAQKLVDGLKESGAKTRLQARLDAVQKVLDDRAADFVAAEEATAKAEETHAVDDLLAAEKAERKLIATNEEEQDKYDDLVKRNAEVRAIVEAVIAANEAIDKVPALDKIDLNNSTIAAARTAVDAALELGATEDEIEKLDTLVAAEAKLDELKAKKVEDYINGLMPVEDLEIGAKGSLTKARRDFDALTDDQKALVSDEAKANLQALEVKMAELEAQAAADAMFKEITVTDKTTHFSVEVSFKDTNVKEKVDALTVTLYAGDKKIGEQKATEKALNLETPETVRTSPFYKDGSEDTEYWTKTMDLLAGNADRAIVTFEIDGEIYEVDSLNVK